MGLSVQCVLDFMVAGISLMFGLGLFAFIASILCSAAFFQNAKEMSWLISGFPAYGVLVSINIISVYFSFDDDVCCNFYGVLNSGTFFVFLVHWIYILSGPMLLSCMHMFLVFVFEDVYQFQSVQLLIGLNYRRFI